MQWNDSDTKLIFTAFFGIIVPIASHRFLLHILSNKKRHHGMIPATFRSSEYASEVLAATEVALSAGLNMTNGGTSKCDVLAKGENDFVTKTDIINETLIFSTLQRQFPSYEFIGEESTCNNSKNGLTNTPTWVVDPIDGTTNFLHSFPFSCVSIGLMVNKIPTVGVVYNPFTKELFQAVRGHGAYLNGKQIKVSGAMTLNKSLVLTELGYDRRDHKMRVMFECMNKLIQSSVHSVRLMGSACMALCYLATGRLDAIYTGVNGDGWYPWDYAAGVCIVSEAGGILTTVTGEPFHIYAQSVVATSTVSLGRELVETLREHIDFD